MADTFPSALLSRSSSPRHANSSPPRGSKLSRPIDPFGVPLPEPLVETRLDLRPMLPDESLRLRINAQDAEQTREG